MRMDKFTQKAAEAIEAARDLASEHSHGQIEAEHLLLALLQQNEGVVPQIVQKIGARPDMLIADMETALRFYANEDDYLWHGDTRGIIQKNDRGEVARAALDGDT